jgi:hypothetical protein
MPLRRRSVAGLHPDDFNRLRPPGIWPRVLGTVISPDDKHGQPGATRPEARVRSKEIVGDDPTEAGPQESFVVISGSYTLNNCRNRLYRRTGVQSPAPTAPMTVEPAALYCPLPASRHDASFGSNP